MRTPPSSRPSAPESNRPPAAFASRPLVARAFRERPFSTLLATGFGSGLSPFAPGTAGSLVTVAAAWLILHPLHGPSIPRAVGLLVSGLAVFAIGIPVTTRAARAMQAKDPGPIVLDEFAGQLIASAAVPLFAFSTPGRELFAWIVSFLSFRIFDVWKPGPIRRLQDLPDGLGIMVDDLLAGLLAAGMTVAVVGALGA
jgi:phosphatidylglycerophosphatase A